MFNDLRMKKIQHDNKLCHIRLINYFILVFLTVTSSHAQWIEKNNGLYGGRVGAIALNGSDIFATVSNESQSRVFRSSNNGTSWILANDGLDGSLISKLITDGNNLFAGSNSGVSISTDKGANWTYANSGLVMSSGSGISALVKSSTGTLFAGTTDNGLFRSVNNASSWVSFPMPNQIKKITSIATNGINILASTQGGGLFRSSNNGDTWQIVSTGIADITFIFSLSYSGTFFYAATNKGLLKSSDNGVTWSINTSVFYSNLVSGGSGIFGLDNSIHYSSDGGLNFTPINTSGITYNEINSLNVNGLTLYVGTEGGLFISTNNGNTWTSANNGITSVYVSAVKKASNGSLFASTHTGVYKSSDNGDNWSLLNTSLTNTWATDLEIIGTTVFVATRGGIFKIGDSGTSWISISGSTGPTFTCDNCQNTMSVDGSSLFVASGGNIYRTTDAGATWTNGTSGNGESYFSVDVLTSIIFGGSSKGVSFSTNNGNSWTNSDNGLRENAQDNYLVRSLYAGGSTVYALKWSGNIFRSTDNGSTWTKISVLPITDNPPNNYAFSLFTIGSSLFAGTNGNGVYRSIDGGTSWVAANEGLTGKYIFNMNAIDGNFFAGTSTGLFTRSLSEINDLTPPNINNTTATSVAVGASVTIKATITDNENPVTSSFVKYRSLATGSTGTLKEAALIKNNGEYTFQVLASEIGLLGLEYQISASSFGGINTTAFKTVKVDYPDGLTVLYSSFGKDVSNYRIIAVPLVLSNDKVSDVFNELLPVDNQKWRIYHYEEANERTRQWSSSDKIIPGLGYWLIVRDNISSISSGEGTSVATTSETPFEIQLKNGYNQIGNPYNYDLKWSDIQDANPGLSILTVFTGNYEPATVLKKMEGGFVKVTSDMNLKFPTKSASGGRVSGDDRPINYALNSTNWVVPLLLRQGDQMNKISGFGMNEKAADGFDRYDGFNMPRFFDRYLELHHTKKDGSDIYSNDVVPRSDHHEWEFSVVSTLGDPIIKLEWNNEYFGDNDQELYLWDVKNSRAINMRTTTQYAFDKSTVSSFKIFYGKSTFIKEKTQVESVVIHEPFPNPATEELKISFTLPELPDKQYVSISLMDLMGRRQWSYQNAFNGGYHKVMWKRNGEASGIYIISVQSGSTMKQLKVILK